MFRESQCPPIRERASKTSTSYVPLRKYAAATPPAPAPMTATRSRLAAWAGAARVARAPSAVKPTAAPLRISRRVNGVGTGRAYFHELGSLDSPQNAARCVCGAAGTGVWTLKNVCRAHGRIRMHVRVAVFVTTLMAVLAVAAPAAAQAPCDPTQTPPQFRGEVPELADVIPFPGGEGGEVTTDQAYAYMEAVDRASNRVVTGALGQRSWQSRELRYAIIGNPGRLEPAALRQIKAAAQTLRDPQTSAAEARSLARRYPEILWVASNVHGGEESGTEGSL